MNQPNLTNRRDFLALTLALTGSGALFLAGCGSGGRNIGVGAGGGSAAVGFVSRRVVVQLPAGFPLPVTSLTAEAGVAAAALDASGAFTVQTPNSTVPSLAMLRDANGRGVLMGFLTPDTPISPRSAAVVLLYYALGGFMLPDASRRGLVTLLEADATTVTVAAAIGQRMIVNPYALEGDDATINAAVKTAFDSLVGTGQPSPQTESLKSALARSRQATTTVDALLQVQPSGLLSNVEIVQGTGAGTTVTAVNHGRRYCDVYVYQTGTPDPLPKAILQGGGPIKLPSTNSLGIFSTINNLRSGQTAYVPISTDPISLTLASGSTKTLYEMIVVGASTNDLPRGFYSDPKYADEQAKWVQDQTDLSTLTWWANLILPIFFEALGIAGLGVTTTAVEGSLAAIKAIGETSVEQLLVNAGKGSFFAAAGQFWELAAESTIVGGKVRAALLPLYEAAAGQLAAETAAARLSLFARLVVRAAIAAVVLLGTGDIGAVLADTALAQPAEQWFATVFQPTLILDPTSKSIAPGGRVTFSVHPPTGTVGTISYAWTQTGANSTLSSSDGIVGNSIVTASTSVDLVTTPSDTGTITVTVVATLTPPSGAASELGIAKATIALNSSTVYTTATPQIVDVTTNGQRALYALFEVTPPSTPWLYAQLLEDGPSLAPYLFRPDYDAGAPTPGGATWTPYGYARNGNGKWFNLGGGVLGVIIVSSGPLASGSDEGGARDALQKELDKVINPRAIFTTSASDLV